MSKRIIAIVLAGLLVRLILLFVVDPSANVLSGDSLYYATGHFDGLRPPLYILFLRLTLPLSLWAPLVIQSALTIASGVAAYMILRSFWTGLLIATCPFLAMFDFRLLSESLYINLLWIGWLLLFINRPLIAGLFIVMTILTRDTILLLPIFSFLLLRTRNSLIVAAVAYLLVAPWAIYTSSSPHRMGTNLWIGTWEQNGDWFLNGMDRPRFPAYAFTSAAEQRAVSRYWMNDEVLGKVAVNRMITHPLGTAKTWAVRYPNLWVGSRSDQLMFRAPRFSLSWKVEKAFFYGLNILLLAFGVWGLLKPHWFFVPPVLYCALVYIPFHAETRYTLMATPFLIWLGMHRLRTYATRIGDSAEGRGLPCSSTGQSS